MSHSSKLQTAELDWEIVDGIEIPISKQFGDVYFSPRQWFALKPDMYF